VLLLHLWLLGTVPKSAGPGWRAEPARAVQVRQLKPGAAADGTSAVSPAPVPVAAPTARPSAKGRLKSTAPELERSTLTTAASGSTPPPTSAATQPADPTAAAPAAAEPEWLQAEPSPDPGGQNVPIYETRLPPAQTLDFDLRRGQASGRAELDWLPSGATYQLTLRGQAVGTPSLSWTSLGGLDPTGLAPLRYTESRRGRELRAVNFQRDAGRVTFSGPPIEYPLVPGGQDRLSWMVQLAAVMAANPSLAQAQSQVSIWVVGTRGDADVWTFTVQDRAALDLPLGRVENTIHLVREPRRPYDTQVQVWLDPARHHLPVQAFLRVRATGVGSEFRLRNLK
jgi:Protein of unknown function (DUF3108)